MPNSFDSRSARGSSGRARPDPLTTLLDRIPGYAGYRDKETRRDADRAVRAEVARGLAAAAERVEAVARDLANRRKLKEVSSVDGWVQALRHLHDRIDSAAYGYGGIMGDKDVGTDALDQLRAFDESLLAELQALEDPIEALEAALVADGDLQSAVGHGVDRTAELSARYDQRGTVLTSGQATAEPKMLEALQTSTLPAVPPTWNLDAGDAISIMGDDFLVDARLEIAAEPNPFRLFRLGERGAGHWLYVPHDASQHQALVQLAATANTPTGNPVATGSAMAEMIGPTGDPRSSTATYDVESSSENADARTIVVAWPNERMVWSGETVAPGDITIFGTAGQAR